jgi:hypothetical protein
MNSVHAYGSTFLVLFCTTWAISANGKYSRRKRGTAYSFVNHTILAREVRRKNARLRTVLLRGDDFV